MSNLIAIAAKTASCLPQAQQLAKKLNLPLITLPTTHYIGALIVTLSHLELQLFINHAPGPIWVDFLTGSLAYRRKHGGGKGQLIAKACGLRKDKNPTILDLTAGFGQDGFILASLGAQVTMVERSPIVAALLQDGITRALQSADWFGTLALQLVMMEAKDYLKQLSERTSKNYPQIIYLDPMYPDLKKSALAKKEMQVLQTILDQPDNAEDLLHLAIAYAKDRVVIKRPRQAPFVKGQQPNLIFSGKSTRFDVYLT